MNLFSNTNIDKLNKSCLTQANLNISQIVSSRNAILNAEIKEELRKQKFFNILNSPWIVEIIHRGAKYDALLEIWCIQMVPQEYTEAEASKNIMMSRQRFELLGKSINWMSRTFPCFSENLNQLKKGDNRKLFELKIKFGNGEEIEKPLLGLYECNKTNCFECETKGRKCTLSTSIEFQPFKNYHNNEPDFYSRYANGSNNEVQHVLVGEVGTLSGDFRVEVVHLNDALHNNVMSKCTARVSIVGNNQKTITDPGRSPTQRIIHDYIPEKKRQIAHSPNSPSTRPISPSTSPLPVQHVNKPISSDHGKSAPVNISGDEPHYNNNISIQINSLNSPQRESNFSFDKDLADILATSPLSSYQSHDSKSPLWKKRVGSSICEEKGDSMEQPSSPRLIEKRRSSGSSRRKSISSKNSVVSSGEDFQFILDQQEDLITGVASDADRTSAYHDAELEDV